LERPWNPRAQIDFAINGAIRNSGTIITNKIKDAEITSHHQGSWGSNNSKKRLRKVNTGKVQKKLSRVKKLKVNKKVANERVQRLTYAGIEDY
jgi:hypothetical protein